MRVFLNLRRLKGDKMIAVQTAEERMTNGRGHEHMAFSSCKGPALRITPKANRPVMSLGIGSCRVQSAKEDNERQLNMVYPELPSFPTVHRDGWEFRKHRESRSKHSGPWYRLLVVLLFLGPLFAASPAYGDFAPYPLSCRQRGSVEAVPHPSIRMDLQKVTMRLKRDRYEVDATFHFFNTGSTVTEEVCFPPKYLFTRYDTWIDGQQTNWVHPEPPRRKGVWDFVSSFFSRYDGIPRFMIQHVTFPGNRQTMIRMRYEENYSSGAPGPSAGYAYGTCWHGNIAETVITINAAGVGGAKNCSIAGNISHFEKVVTDNTIELSLKDVKPDWSWVLNVYAIPGVKDPIF